MKILLRLFIAVLFFSFASLQAQDLNADYLYSKLEEGYPEEVAIMVDGLEKLKSTTLDTGLDSIKAFFGSTVQNNREVYWASLYYNKRNTFSMFVFENRDSLGLLSEDIEFNLDNSSLKVSAKFIFNPDTDELYYLWKDNNGLNRTAFVEKVTTQIQENRPMPDFTVEGLDGETKALEDYKGKYLVINWWSTTCKPCILEMPGLNELVQNHQERSDIEFLAIAWDDKEKLNRFLGSRPFDYFQTLSNPEVNSIFGNSFPKHIIVNPKGIVSFYLEGGNTDIHHLIEEAIQKEIQ